MSAGEQHLISVVGVTQPSQIDLANYGKISFTIDFDADYSNGVSFFKFLSDIQPDSSIT